MRADRNRDGRIEWAEIIAHAKAAPLRLTSSQEPAYIALLALDVDGDGRVTLAEFEAGLEKKFAEYDTDGDGRISQAEFDAYWQGIGKPAPKVAEIQETFEEKLERQCALPKASKDARVVLFNGNHGVAMSTVAIGSQDKKTTTSKVIIESGRQPLYLILITHGPIVWQFEGDIKRIERAVLVAIDSLSPALPAGAVGLPKELVTFGGPGQCLNFWVNMNQQYQQDTRRRLRNLIGREPDDMPYAYDIWNLRLPSGAVSRPTAGEQRLAIPNTDLRIGGVNEMLSELFTYDPGGVVRIDPAAVISALPAATYEVLPEHAGIIQLLLDGSMEMRGRNEFVIRKAMRFPAGLGGVLTPKFVIARGVPVPTGDPVHSVVISEETGEAICLNDLCRQRAR
jgi:hypothetical protein